MTDMKSWDWAPGKRTVADLKQWRESYDYMEEPAVSPDGEKIAAIVKTEDLEFGICENGELWEATFEKAWNLKFDPDGRLTTIVSDVGEWTLAVDGEAWENKYDFVWNTLFGRSGGHAIVSAQAGGEYLAVVDDTPWDNQFMYMTEMAGSPNGQRACGVVQTIKFPEGDIYTFQKGCYTIAVDGTPWDTNFVNAWQPVFSPDSRSVAAQVRTSLYDYTIVVDGTPWDAVFPMIWEPTFSPADGGVVAPVKTPAGWMLYKNGAPLWQTKFAQLWRPTFSRDGALLAAIAAPVYGRWTVAVDGAPWKATFGAMVTDLVISPSGGQVACLGKEEESWFVVVNGKPMDGAYDMAFRPVFSPDGRHVAARVEKDGQKLILVDNTEIGPFAHAWDPIFSPEGDKILIRAITGDAAAGTYVRQVRTLDSI